MIIKEVFMRLIFLLILLMMQSFAVNAELYAVDGDSLEGEGRRIRLEGIDAPEYKQYCFDENKQEYMCGQDSLKYLQDLMANKKIHCRCEPELDRYKRELCVCFADDLELNKQMVAAGQAVSYLSQNYKAEEKQAQAQKLGIWRGKFMRPALYRALNREKEKKWCKDNPEECKLKKKEQAKYRKKLSKKKSFY